MPPLELPPPQSKETIETYRSPDESLYPKPLPILNDAEELKVYRSKQTDIDKFLQILKAKVTKSNDLSVTATELVKEHPHSPDFSSIYNSITQNVLPKDKSSQRRVTANAENYIVANGVLFRLMQQKRYLILQSNVFLLYWKKLKIVYFTCFMIHYLVHIMVLSTHTTLSKIAIGYIICLKNYKDIYPRVKCVNNKNRNEVRFLILIQGFH